MRTLQWVAPFAVLAALTACRQPDAVLSSSDVAAIRALYPAWAEATIGKKWEAAAGLMTVDQWLSAPNEPGIDGRSALFVWLKANYPTNLSQQTWVVDEVTGHGNLAYARATATETYSRPDGTQYTEHSACLNVIRRQADGAWLFSRSSCHVIDPVPPQAPGQTP